MGVLGLTPFLQKTCPQVIRQIPDGLRSLRGKRIVIDGTLITQRFHFAPMSQHYRHVLSWYRLAKELRENDIEAICVFDGTQRTLAKGQEIVRRRRGRMVIAARSEFEIERFSRLRRLTRSLLANGVPMEKWGPLGVGLATLNSPFIGVAVPFIQAGTGSEGPRLHTVPDREPRISAPPISYDSSGALELAESLQAVPPLSLRIVPPESPDGSRAPRLDPATDSAPTVGPSVNVSQLYTEYCQSIPRLATMPEPPTNLGTLDTPSSPTPDEEVRAFKSECALSRSQQDLVLEEGKLWEQLKYSAKSGTVSESVVSLAETLEVRSGILSESYRRRTHPPSGQTYEESRDILRAMGIPCIETSGPYEAEALAASLVLKGHADYVASEDTDVLVYDAPLIRNIANQKSPLILISGPEVRAALDLDRARFIDFALLLGTDFSQRIKNVGPKRALKFIRQYGTIENVLEHEKYPTRVPPEEYLTQVNLARLVFQTLPPVPDQPMIRPQVANNEEVSALLKKYDLHHCTFELDDWDRSQALSGNYFADSPSAA